MNSSSTPAGVVVSDFGTTQDGHAVKKFTITNANGMSAEFLDYGATLSAVFVADKQGELVNVVLTTDSMNQRQLHAEFFGSTVGRFCNRIAEGQFKLDGQEFQLARNNGHNHLHGGDVGFDKLVWHSEVLEEAGNNGVRFELHSPDGDEGYPGSLTVVATYRLNDQNELTMDFTATTDRATPINICNHAYWNLAGCNAGNILQHELKLNAAKYLEVDEGLIPTGELKESAGSPLDFLQTTAIGKNIQQVNSTPANGFDHCYAVDGAAGELRTAAVARDPNSGRTMEVLTTQPGIQLYTANHLDGSTECCGFIKNGGFCLETQNFPDAPNKPEFPSSILKPGENYHHRTIHRFSVS